MNKLIHIINPVKKYWLTIGFLLGFTTDVILLNNLNHTFDNVVLLFHTTLATVSLWLFYYGVANQTSTPVARFFQRYAPLIMQYSFGGLLSGMLIFYGRSGEWLVSWPFLLVIVTVIVGNELIEKRSNRLVYQLGLYFTGLMSYVVLMIPVVIKEMGDGVFMVSGLIAGLLMIGVVFVLFWIIPPLITINKRRIVITLGSIYVGFNSLYFIGIIPPIPLSLSKLEIGQAIERLPGLGYKITTEEQAWYTQLPFIHETIQPQTGQIICFARVFAPIRLETDIYHRWEYKDSANKWQEYARIKYPIAGVNDNGYGGYTYITNFHAGVWRCSVETKRGQVLGRTTFQVQVDGAPLPLVTKIE